MTNKVAIIGIACCYPDARSPVELWENVLAQRRAFRRLPPERLNLADYLSPDKNAPDCTYATEAAVIEGYEFDRAAFRVAGSTFRAADLAHWLALDVAAQALADAGFPDGKDLPREATGVLLGNTLTGEFSRANTMRLRWPYVRRVLEAALIEENWTVEQRQAFLQNLEAQYKAPFPEIGEETLAGNLSNTIAGRICNYFDFKGGGYTVDGACSSSLLAVANACSALVAGDLDVAIAGGVDLSLDPFELVGFAKAGALAPEEMRVYDALSAGFWPGEGCGFAVLMRSEDAIKQQRRIYATIRGWGISSDGNGGITRPEIEGQLLALKRAYHRANFGIETVAYFEGHGTGTSVGDMTELQTLSRARRERGINVGAGFTNNLTTQTNNLNKPAPVGEFPNAAVISSIKANIGHTKAAAGIAGFIKATMALHCQILPPTTGCEQPHQELLSETANLRSLKQGQIWPQDLPLCAGVSAMGFGGINTHVVLEGTAIERRQILNHPEQMLLSSAQDTELILLAGQDAEELQQQVEHLLKLSPRLSRSEVTDLAAELAKTLKPGLVRVAIATTTPKELTNRLEILNSWLSEGVTNRLDIAKGIFLGTGITSPRIGFLFPGQGSPFSLDGGAWSRRFEYVQELYSQSKICHLHSQAGDWERGKIQNPNTAIAQPAIATAAMAGLRVLNQLEITANIAVGHSLGELIALHWAGAFDETSLTEIASVRGKAMADLDSPTGKMASIRASEQQVKALLNKPLQQTISKTGETPIPQEFLEKSNSEEVVIAGLNSPRQTVISGEAEAVAAVIAKANTQNFKTVNLPVSHAFHSPLVAAAAKPLAKYLLSQDFSPLQGTVISTVTGNEIEIGDDLRSLLTHQITAPVRFIEAITKASQNLNLLIEVGPGRVLSSLVTEFINLPAIAIDAGSSSLSGLLNAIGAAFALGAPINPKALFADRFTRPFNLNWQPKFFTNPCETIERQSTDQIPPTSLSPSSPITNYQLPITNYQSPLDLVRQLVATRLELPVEAVKNDSRLLSDLHLNSITVGQLVAEAAKTLNLAPPVAPTDYADATIAEVAQALEQILCTNGSHSLIEEKQPSGVDSWIETFTVELREHPLKPEIKPQNSEINSAWQILTPRDYPLADALQQAFDRCPGNGVIICLLPELDESQIDLLLEGAKFKTQDRLILVQHGGVGAAFARTFYLENPQIATCVVNIPLDFPQATELIIAEAKAAVGYVEAHYDRAGIRRSPYLILSPIGDKSDRAPTLTSNDVLLVTGGGKGIAAECALYLAKETGVRLALLGRSNPESDLELANNLTRFTASGIQVKYVSVDVRNAAAVKTAIAQIEAELGKVTAIIHGAGVNTPKLIKHLDKKDFLCTLAPKVQGARNVLAAINPENLRLFVTFGSIIARVGLPGEADYALANEWLANLTEQLQQQYPNCRCLNLEWSVWSGAGMGERLGRIDALIQQGITPITVDKGIAILSDLISTPTQSTSVIIAGRFGESPTLKLEKPELPFLRFLEQPRVYYPGVELVVDVEISTDTDPYLNDHTFQNQRILPGVIGLEAMAQVVMALAETSTPPIFADVKFNRPVVVPTAAPLKIRLAALKQTSGKIEVVLRSEQTNFGIDHFRATCYFETGREQQQRGILGERSHINLDPASDLYGNILFHQGRFQRLKSYRYLKATECLAEIIPETSELWFGRYLPQELILGDPAARDAAIHALQACVPHATILPIGIERLAINQVKTSRTRFVSAKERERLGNTFIYDLEVLAEDGLVLETWEGLQLQIIQPRDSKESWAASLLPPYLERQIREMLPNSHVTIAIEKDGKIERKERSDRAIQQAIGSSISIWRRTDGKPEILNGKAISVAHTGNLTLAVAGTETIGCDLEPIVSREVDVWRDLLGQERFSLANLIAEETHENLDTAATIIWTASECLKKAGQIVDSPLTLVNSTVDGWVWLASGNLTIATFVASIQELTNQLVLAVLIKQQIKHSLPVSNLLTELRINQL